MPQTKICFTQQEHLDLIDRKDIELLNEIEIGEDAVQVTYRFLDEHDADEGMTSYQLVSFVTSYARIMLYNLMDSIETKGGEGSVLYCDTDSCVYVEKDGQCLAETGETLGQLTDEVLSDTGDPGAFICRASFTAPKSYFLVYKLSNGEERLHIKAKGITLHSAAAEIITEDSINELIQAYPRIKTILVPQKVIYSTTKSQLITRESEKIFRIVTGKRVVLEDGSTLPYGYKRLRLEDNHDDDGGIESAIQAVGVEGRVEDSDVVGDVMSNLLDVVGDRQVGE